MAHAHHHHGPGAHTHGSASERHLLWAFAIIASFMLVEVAGGLISGSLALLADAGHMVSDAAALGFSWYALRAGRRQATEELSYGWRRMEVLAAFVNGLALLAIGLWIVFKAVQRLFQPAPVLGGTMLAVAVAGLLANVVALAILARADRDNLNLRSALWHVLGDLFGSVAAIAAAIIILRTGWTPIDPILSLLVALIIGWGALRLIRESGHILLEGTPPHLDIATIRSDLENNVPGVAGAHHIHIWSMTADQHLLTLHATPHPGANHAEVIHGIGQRLQQQFGIAHITVQVEEDHCLDPVSNGPASPAADGTGTAAACDLVPETARSTA